MVATAGVLPPEPVADLTEQLLGHHGTVTVVTVIEVPHTFLDAIRAEEWRPLTEDQPAWPSDERALVARYVDERGHRLVDPILAALRARGIHGQSLFLESRDAARAIVQAAEELGADVIMLGATRAIFDESSWESVAARVIREARRPVVVIPPPQRVGEAVPFEA